MNSSGGVDLVQFAGISAKKKEKKKKFNVVLNAETFYKSNVNCTFFIQNKPKNSDVEMSCFGEETF